MLMHADVNWHKLHTYQIYLGTNKTVHIVELFQHCIYLYSKRLYTKRL